MSKRTKKILKARKKMNKAVSAELAPFGIRKAKYTGEYSYSFKKNRVDYKVTNTAIEDKWFDEFVKERFRYDVFSDFIISILHEIGHAKANENITDDIYEFCMAEKARIGVEMMVAETEGYKDLRLIKGAGHAESVLKEPEEYKEYVKEFLDKVYGDR